MTSLPSLMFILPFISTFQWPNSTAQHTYILHRFNIYPWSSTRDYPESTSSVNQDNITLTTTLSYKEDQKNDSVTGIKNMTADIVLPTANLTNSSSVVFPISTDEKTKINKFIPENTVIEKCSLNETFCIKVENYPREDVYKIFRTSKFMSTPHYDEYAKDEVNDFETRILSDVELQPFCQSRSEVIYPEAGLTSKNEWRYIVQAPAINASDTFIKQGIVVEKCIDFRDPCRFDDTLPYGYVSRCVQKYIYKRLLSVQGPYQFSYDYFLLPSCCQCMFSIN
ncbi:unnamed protein product [Macrosiphum euphorbiae]|uniref:Spaetzle domain-containing protein n=1 Tax=Macrosiphum euphorbiae TaxID=13131 RepID=A0AAV0WFP7_9HEMI|nr:unnamed protein product [Macrosiphum euphorbiae]